jgi:hypothetical protein
MAVCLSQLPFEVGGKDSNVSLLVFSPFRYSKVLVGFIASQAIPPDILVRPVSDFDVAGSAMIDSARRIYLDRWASPGTLTPKRPCHLRLRASYAVPSSAYPNFRGLTSRLVLGSHFPPPAFPEPACCSI